MWQEEVRAACMHNSICMQTHCRESCVWARTSKMQRHAPLRRAIGEQRSINEQVAGGRCSRNRFTLQEPRTDLTHTTIACIASWR